MPISEAYRKRLPILTRTIFEDVMKVTELQSKMVDIPAEFVKEQLNQKIWNGDELRPEVREKMLKIVEAYKEHLNLAVEPKAIRFLGSMANYNWTEVSDVDIHLFYDLSKISDNPEFAKEFLEAKGTEWKNKHRITFRGYTVEMYAQDIKDIFYSGGVYDLLKNKWVSKPSRDKVVVDKALLRKKIAAVATEITKIKRLARKDINAVYGKAKALKDKIKRMRQAGLESDGEYSIENLTFKYLRNKGYLEKLSDVVLKAFDAQLSLDETMKQNLSESIHDVSVKVGIDARHLKQTVFKGKRNPNLIITVTMTRNGKIVDIENNSAIRFPYSVGQTLNRGHETWACNNHFLVNGKDTCPEEKIFGIRKKDIPQGHELRMLYPGKFKNESTEKVKGNILKAAKKAEIDIGAYDASQINKGFEVEKEHGKINPKTNVTDDDEVLTLKIALAHLDEVPDYYDKLEKYVEKDKLSESDIIWSKGIATILESYNKNKKNLISETKSNPWAVCHASVGKEKTDKFERCAKDVKKNNNITEDSVGSKKHKLIIKKSVDNLDEAKIKLVKEFIIDCCKELDINEPCIVYLTGARGGPITTTASYNPSNDEIWIYVKNRNMLGDILRSIAHEITHMKQKIRGELTEESGNTGSTHENEANSMAGIMIRKFGKTHPEIFN